MAKRLIKSAEENLNEDENQFELDEQAIDEISNAEEFADVEISNEDIMDAVEAIDALATAVIEKADGEEKTVDADELLDAVTDMLDDSHEEEEPTSEESNEEEFEFTEEEELPEEIESSVVRVMVSEDGAIDLEQKPDEIYQSDVDGLDATVFDTTDDYEFAVEDEAPSEDIEDDTLIIGNSASKKMKKGYITIKSCTDKKLWSSAFKKVKKMVGSAKFTPAHWAIVSAMAAKAEAEAKLNKQIQSKLVNYIKSNKDLKTKFFSFIKSDVAGQDTQPDIQPEGQTATEAKPDMTAEPKNNGFEEQANEGVPSEAGKPEGVEQPSGNPTEDPDKQNEREGEIALPEEDIVVVDVPLTNSVRHVRLQKVRSSKGRNYNLYKVVSDKASNILDGKVVKSGKIAYCFRSTSQGIIACCARFVSNGKGTYKPVLKNNKIVITRGGELAPVFQNYEKICLAKAIVSAKREGFEGGKKAVMSAKRTPATPTRRPVTSARQPVQPTRRPVNNEIIKSQMDARRAERQAKQAIESKAKLVKMHEAEERQRLFQSSQTQMNEERVAIKSNNARNTAALENMYKNMF